MSFARRIRRHDAPGTPRPREPSRPRVPPNTPYLGQLASAHISLSRPARLVARANARREELAAKRERE